MATEDTKAAVSQVRGRTFRSSLRAPVQTLVALGPDVVEALAAETGSRAVGGILSAGIARAKERPHIEPAGFDWDFSWDFSWDYSSSDPELPNESPARQIRG